MEYSVFAHWKVISTDAIVQNTLSHLLQPFRLLGCWGMMWEEFVQSSWARRELDVV